MNANELMIGDWVMIKNYPMKAIPTKVAPQHFVRSLVEFEPIPLTADILEKNGFEHKTDIVWHDIYVLKYRIKLENKELERDQTLMLAKDPYDVFYWVPEMSAVSALDFRFVHELQHLMKMLGIQKEVKV